MVVISSTSAEATVIGEQMAQVRAEQLAREKEQRAAEAAAQHAACVAAQQAAMQQVEIVDAPGQEKMEEEPCNMNEPFAGPGLTVKQTMKGCFQECCGCEAASEYKISAYVGDFAEGGSEGNPANIMYALEESNCCFRTCCPSMRPLEMNVSLGSEKGGPLVAKYTKGWNFPLCFTIPLGDRGAVDCPCCCCMPRLTAFDDKGKELGTAKYICDAMLLVPKFGWFENDKMIYYLAPETCCGGCCMWYKCGGTGGKAIYAPFHFRDPVSKEKLADGSGIAKLWSGMKKECCSDADNFALKFPSNASISQRKGLLGLNFLVDLVWFETHK